MDLSRRALVGGLSALAGGGAQATTMVARPGKAGLLEFPTAPPQIVDFHRWLDKPVVLKSAELLIVDGKHEFVRVTSEAGHEGVVKANSYMEEVASLFHVAVKPNFLGRDVRDLRQLVEHTYRTQYKLAGLPLWTAIGHLELAIWDMLGKTAGVRCVEFMGPIQRTEIPIYVSSLVRDTSPEAEVAAVQEGAAKTGARACKIKVGGRMSLNQDASPGRSEKLVALARKKLGDDFTIYCDANGSYDAPRAIELCRMLQAHGVAILEEPCPHDDPEMMKQVTDRVDVTIAGGEQDGRMEHWRWCIANRGVDVIQPDFMYNGGMLRTLMVQRMAQAAGMGVAPHYPRNGAEIVELIHFAAYAPNLHGFQEYRLDPRVLDFPHAPRIEPREGKLHLPPGTGFGITYDPTMWRTATRF